MTYPEAVYRNLQDVIQAQLDFMINYRWISPSQRKRIVTHQDIVNALLYFEGGSLAKELKRAGLDITPSAFIQRRHQLPSSLFQDILVGFSAQDTEPERFHGYRVCAVDGSSADVAYDPNAKTFVQHSGAQKGYNQVKITAIYDVLSKMYLAADIRPQPEQDEIGALESLLLWHYIDEKILIVGDRLYSSYALFASLLERQDTDFLIRVKQGRGAMKCIADLPMCEFDRQVKFTITTTQTKEDKEQGYIFLQTQKNPDRTYSENTRAGRWRFPSPYPMQLRIIRLKLSIGEYETLATSLPTSITASQVKELYHARWGIETAFRELKYNHGITHIHGKSEKFAYQEIYAAMIFSNFCSKIIRHAVIQSWKNGKLYEVNRKMAGYLCKEYLRNPSADGEKLMRDIEKYVVPVKPGQQNPRNLRTQSWRGFGYRVSA